MTELKSITQLDEDGMKRGAVLEQPPEGQRQGKRFVCDLSLFTYGFFMGLVPSMYDVVTDVFTVENYLGGASYFKTVSDPNDSAIHEECDFIRNKTSTEFSVQGGSETTFTFTYRCLELDPIFGYLSLALIFIPALRLLGSKLFDWPAKCLFLFTFPLALISVKVVKLFTKLKTWEKRAIEFVIAESMFESRFQLIVQLFIIFTMAHRQPSGVQLASMLGSIVLMTKVEIENYMKKMEKKNSTEVGVGMKHKLGLFLSLIPLCLSSKLSWYLSFALQIALLRYNYIWVFVFGIVMMVVELLLKKYSKRWGKCSKQILPTPFLPTTTLLTDLFVAHILPYTILLVFTVMANLNYDPAMVTFYPFIHTTYTLNSMPIVSKLHRFNTLVGAIFSLEIVHRVLWYFQIGNEVTTRKSE